MDIKNISAGAGVTEAKWGEATKSPHIDWHMSAALRDVPRGDGDLAEVTSLERAVRAWLELDPHHRGAARLTLERPLLLDGVAHAEFKGEAITILVEQLPANASDPK